MPAGGVTKASETGSCLSVRIGGVSVRVGVGLADGVGVWLGGGAVISVLGGVIKASEIGVSLPVIGGVGVRVEVGGADGVGNGVAEGFETPHGHGHSGWLGSIVV